MRTSKIALIAALSCVVGSGMAFATGPKNTPHDFSRYDWEINDGIPQGEICLPCHTPHNAYPYASQKTDALSLPLWNHKLTQQSFTLWSTNYSLGVKSRFCLGCHDGQTGLDSYGGTDTSLGSRQMTGENMIGTDLTDDHPVGVQYPMAVGDAATSWEAITANTRGGANVKWIGVNTVGSGTNAVTVSFTNSVSLYATASGYNNPTVGRYSVECESCHQVHDDSYGKFLRFANNNPANPSALCLTCHKSKR